MVPVLASGCLKKFSNQRRRETPGFFRGGCQTEFVFPGAGGPKSKRPTVFFRKQTGVETFVAVDAMKNHARGGDDAWIVKKYFNIWFCDLGGKNLVYSSLPGSPADKDGV